MFPVVVGIDGSKASECALRWALPIAKAIGAPVRAVTIVPPAGWPVSTEAGGWYAVDLAAAELDARARLDRTVGAAVGAEERWAIEREVRTGAAAHLLVDESARASMVVIGSRRRSALARLLDGSIQSTLLRHASCPVVVVPEHHETAAVTASIDRALALAG
jgi:nucleotide-binding universal stress UspA family protein